MSKYKSKNQYTVLDAVTANTARVSLELGLAETIQVTIAIPVNTTAVTVTTSGYDGTNWVVVDTTTKEATTGNFVVYHKDANMWEKIGIATSAQTNATVSAYVNVGA